MRHHAGVSTIVSGKTDNGILRTIRIERILHSRLHMKRPELNILHRYHRRNEQQRSCGQGRPA